MAYVTFTIDGTEVRAKKGENLLWAALDNGLYIPSLCAIRNADVSIASCRLCFVEIKGKDNPVTSCTETVSDGMIVQLNTPKIERLRSTAFELLLSHHKLDCRSCAKNGNCELQSIAAHLGLKLKLKRFRQIPRDIPVDSSHDMFIYEPGKCVLCGKCVWACRKWGTGILDFAFKGMDSRISTIAGVPLAESGCNSCLACVAVCPVGALVAKPGISLDKARALASTAIGAIP